MKAIQIFPRTREETRYVRILPCHPDLLILTFTAQKVNMFSFLVNDLIAFSNSREIQEGTSSFRIYLVAKVGVYMDHTSQILNQRCYLYSVEVGSK